MVERERGGQGGPRAPSPSGPNWTRGAAPLSFLLSPSFPPSPTPTRKEGVLLPVGVGLPLARPPPRAGLLLPCSFIYGGRGHPRTHKLIYGSFLSRVRCPPSTIVLLDNIVAVLRRSPATVEHQDRQHAVVLTELFPDTLLDRSPGIVIELNVCKNSEVPE